MNAFGGQLFVLLGLQLLLFGNVFFQLLGAPGGNFGLLGALNAQAPSGTSWPMVEPAAVKARLPTLTGATRLGLQPMNA